MTKAEIKETAAACVKDKQLLRIFLRYDAYSRFNFPLKLSDKLFLVAEEDDFQIDGYAVRRFCDITKAQRKNDMCEEILKREGIVDSIAVPDVDVADWQTVFQSLQKRNRNIIVEKESLNEDKSDFVIGRIEKVSKHFAYVRHFDADGIWQDELNKILYTAITTVKFASRYVDTFSKYLTDLPDNFGKCVINPNPWKCDRWKAVYAGADCRTGLRLKFGKGVDAEVKRALTEFSRWLRKTYPFPIRVPVYIKSNEKIRAMDGKAVSATFFGPSDKFEEPYIRLAAGDYPELLKECGQDNALCAVLCSFSHELTHYFQWLNNFKQSNRSEESQAEYYEKRIVDDYADTKEHP